MTACNQTKQQIGMATIQGRMKSFLSSQKKSANHRLWSLWEILTSPTGRAAHWEMSHAGSVWSVLHNILRQMLYKLGRSGGSSGSAAGKQALVEDVIKGSLDCDICEMVAIKMPSQQAAV